MAAHQLDCVAAVRGYLDKALDDVGGMKALLLDEETTPIVSLAASQTDVIGKETFLISRIADRAAAPAPGPGGAEEAKAGAAAAAAAAPKMHHLKAVVLVRASRSSVDALVAHLARPRFKEYHVFFTSFVADSQLAQIAEADEFEVVKQVQEYYADYYAVNPDLFSLNAFRTRELHQPEAYWREAERSAFRRNVDGVLGLLLSLKKRPAVRYSRGSELAKRTAYEVARRMKEDASLFHFQQGSTTPLLLVLDRRDDPVTPLLTQWTYQAMVHELVGITNNRVDMHNVPNVRKENREIVLSCEQDRFFKSSMYLNFGDLGASIKDLVERYRREVGSTREISTIDDMKKFVENYPEFRALSGNVSKHVAVVTELSRLVELRALMEVSETEQELACHADHSGALEAVLRLLDDPHPSDEDRLRLVCLYALRYENGRNQLGTLKSMLRDRAATAKARNRTRAVDALLNHCGSGVRSGDLFGQKGLAQKLASMFGGGLKGVENIYTQHRPVLSEQLEQLAKGKLRTTNYPYVDGSEEKHQDVIVYIVGGVTYEEALAVHTINAAGNGMRVVLGGSSVHNSRSFIDDVLGSDDASASA